MATVREVALPRPVVDFLAAHLVEEVGPADDALVFAGDKGGVMHRSNFNKRVHWTATWGFVQVAGSVSGLECPREACLSGMYLACPRLPDHPKLSGTVMWYGS